MAQAIWADEFARSISDLEETEESDLWHVRLSSDEVKVLPLDRLDDLFRLSIVDESTLVWQAGMNNWLPLGVVAGLENEPEAPTVPVHQPPRPALQPLGSFGVISAPQAVALYVPERRIDSRAPESARMISVSDIEIQPLREGGSFGRWLMVLAVFAGLALTLYRNDVLRQAATNVGAGAAYARLERALGGPSFGTPRAVEELAASDGRAPAAAAGPSTAAAAPATAPAVPATTAPAAPVATSPEKPAAAVAAPEPSAVSLDSLPLEQKVGASISAELLKPKGTVSANPAPAARPKASSPRQSTSSVAKQVTQKRRARGSASDYDPLNGKL